MCDTTIAEYVREMSQIFRDHKREHSHSNIADLTLTQAYAVQDVYVAERVRTQGKVVGWKVGCTSIAIRQQFGLEQPISGRLFEHEIHRHPAVLHASAYIDCAVEPELVFRLGADLEGKVSQSQVLESIATVAPGIELHNYRFWYGMPTSQELIASNGIHAGMVIGNEQPWPQALDINSEEVSVLVNGEVRASALCSEIMGEGPLRSVQWLAEHAAERGRRLFAGEIIIPGSAVKLLHVHRGDQIESRFATLGACSARLV